MRRREFITLLGGAAASWPLAAHAQQPERVRRIGWLGTGAEGTGSVQDRLNAFKRGLADLGWIEGRNLAFERRWANNDTTRLRSHAAELAGLRPDLIFVTGSESLLAMRQATGIIPIVFALVFDPVGQGFVSSLAQPGGNITGFATSEFALATKNLELLKKISPAVTRVAFVFDPAQPTASGNFAEVEAAAALLGIEVSKIPTRNPDDIERSINALASAPNGGLFVVPGTATGLHLDLIVALAARHRLPAVFSGAGRQFVAGGGLASYGADDFDLCRRAASYAEHILKGEKPADLPVQLPTKYELIINLKTAKALGLTVPNNLLSTADEVIE
jgi:putative tryptophan/tyrosine transport system substrate-binding protein